MSLISRMNLRSITVSQHFFLPSSEGRGETTDDQGWCSHFISNVLVMPTRFINVPTSRLFNMLSKKAGNVAGQYGKYKKNNSKYTNNGRFMTRPTIIEHIKEYNKLKNIAKNVNESMRRLR